MFNDEPDGPVVRVDTARPSSPRAYSFAAGGKDHFAADRQAARQIMAMSADAARAAADNRAFLSRAVAHVARRGIRQFTDIGAGLPLPGGNVHDWALAADPGARVCYVDSDPEVVVHLQGQVEHRPRVAAVLGDLRNPCHFLTSGPLQRCIDLSQPVAVILGAVLHFLGHTEAHDAVEVLKRAVVPGSYLVISHATRDGAQPGEAEEVQGTYEKDLAAPLTLREGREIGAFFDGWEWAGPGLVNINEWRNPVAVRTRLILYGGVARKPGRAHRP